MAAVLRVKRRSDEEPLDALVFACKRKKISHDENKETSEQTENPFTVVKFAATVKSQDDDISVLLPINDREDIWHSKLRHKVDLLKKNRQQRKQHSEHSRYKVVNCFRHVEPEKADISKHPDQTDVIIFEVESSVDDKSVQKKTTEDDIHYVYDIYYGQTSKEYDFVSLDHLVDIMPYSETLDFGPHNDDSDDEISDAADDDDSNEENNWRNDYPDSDNSVNEDDMRLAMQLGDMNLGQDNELSSSDEDLINEHSGDPQDVEYYGEVYAKYKARVQKEFNDDIESSDEGSSVGEKICDSENENEDPVLRFM